MLHVWGVPCKRVAMHVEGFLHLHRRKMWFPARRTIDSAAKEGLEPINRSAENRSPRYARPSITVRSHRSQKSRRGPRSSVLKGNFAVPAGSRSSLDWALGTHSCGSISLGGRNNTESQQDNSFAISLRKLLHEARLWTDPGVDAPCEQVLVTAVAR